MHFEEDAQKACKITYLLDQRIGSAAEALRIEAVPGQSCSRADRGSERSLGQHRRRQRKLLHIHVDTQLGWKAQVRQACWKCDGGSNIGAGVLEV